MTALGPGVKANTIIIEKLKVAITQHSATPLEQHLAQPASQKLLSAVDENRYRDSQPDMHVKDLGTLRPKWNDVIKSFPSGFREPLEREAERV